MKSNLLKSARVKQSLTQQEVAKKIGISSSSYSYKESGSVSFKLNEINKLMKILNLTQQDVFEIFFTDKVELNSTLCS